MKKEKKLTQTQKRENTVWLLTCALIVVILCLLVLSY